MAAPLADAGLLDVNGTLIAEVIAFLVMLAILAKYVYPPVMRAAETREQQIEAGLRAAEEAGKRLTAVQQDVERTLEEARVQARDIVDRAHQDAAADAEELRARSRRESDAQRARARADIVAERDRAITELRAQVGTLVVAAAGQVLGQAIDEATHHRLIEESLERVSAGV